MKSISEFAPHARAVKRLRELEAQLAEKERERDKLSGLWIAEIGEERDTPLQAAAKRIAAGEPLNGVPSSKLSAREQVATLSGEIAVLRAAVDLCKRDMERAWMEASRIACEAAADQHRRLVRQVVDAVIALARANAAEYELREGIEKAGFGTGLLRAMNVPSIGRMEPDSGAALYLGEALEFGFIDYATFRKLTEGKVEVSSYVLERIGVAKPVKRILETAVRGVREGWAA